MPTPALQNHPAVASIVAAARPFVSRLLRGKRLRRQLMLSGILAALCVVVGSWLALGAGQVAYDVRHGTGLEPSRIMQQRLDHVLLVDTKRHERRLAGARHRLQANPDDDGYSTDSFRRHAEFAYADTQAGIQARAQACTGQARARMDALAAKVTTEPRPHARPATLPFSCTAAQVARLEHYVATNYLPHVRRYSSPLGLGGVLTLIGVAAAVVLAGLWMLAAPLWVGTIVAQEMHENTLQPLTGTALSSRQLALGLLAGPLVAIGVLAAPTAGLFLLTALSSGSVLIGAAALAQMFIVSALLCVAALLVGLSIGAQRSPGVVGITLLAALGGALGLGIAVVTNLQTGPIGPLALIPPGAPLHLLRETFVSTHFSRLGDAAAVNRIVGISALAFVVLAAIGLRAADRWIARTSTGVLTRLEAGGAALTISMLILLALDHRGPSKLSMLIGVSGAMIAIPLLLLLMARVPAGETPPSLRRIPVVALLSELAVAVAGHALLCVVVADRVDFSRTLGGGNLHTLWGIAVAGLVAIRFAGAPSTLGTRALLGLAMATAVFEAGAGIVLAHDRVDLSTMLLPMAELSAFLGLLQLVLLVLVPAAVVRSLITQGIDIGPSGVQRPQS